MTFKILLKFFKEGEDTVLTKSDVNNENRPLCCVPVHIKGVHIISTPSFGDLWERDNLTLQCDITEGTYVSYEWLLNGSPLQHNSKKLHFSSLSSKDSGEYVCVAKNYFNETDYSSNKSKGRNVHVKGRVITIYTIQYNFANENMITFYTSTLKLLCF